MRVKTHWRWSTFHLKKWCITIIAVHNKLKSWWFILAIINIKKKPLESTWQQFGTQSSLWIKINLDPMVRWRWLDKINVYKI